MSSYPNPAAPANSNRSEGKRRIVLCRQPHGFYRAVDANQVQEYLAQRRLPNGQRRQCREEAQRATAERLKWIASHPNRGFWERQSFVAVGEAMRKQRRAEKVVIAAAHRKALLYRIQRSARASGPRPVHVRASHRVTTRRSTSSRGSPSDLSGSSDGPSDPPSPLNCGRNAALSHALTRWCAWRSDRDPARILTAEAQL